MVLSIQPGVYAIRNVAESDYIYPENGYATAGRKIFINSWVQDGSIKVLATCWISYERSDVTSSGLLFTTKRAAPTGSEIIPPTTT